MIVIPSVCGGISSAHDASANLSGSLCARDRNTGADLSSANLTSANLTWAYLFNANLTGANLLGANFTDATHASPYFTNATHASPYFWGVFWNNTTCPDGTVTGTEVGTAGCWRG